MKTELYAAAAVAAFRLNGNELLTTPDYDENPMPGTLPKVDRYPNKDLINRWINSLPEYATKKVVAEKMIPVLKITEQDIIDARLFMQKSQQAMIIATLKGKKSSGFVNSITALTSLEELTAQQVRKFAGLIVYVPKMGFNQLNEELARDKVMQYNSSRHIGSIDEKVVLKITVLTNIHLRNRSCYLIKAVDIDGNLVIFFNNNGWTVDQQYKIKARIKRHEHERETNFCTTVVNYVKKI